MDKYKMVAGETYRITLRDCCITGELRGVFVRWDGDHDADDADDADAVFDIGTIGPLWGKWEVEPEKTPDEEV